MEETAICGDVWHGAFALPLSILPGSKQALGDQR
jgi:hypothetical protein